MDLPKQLNDKFSIGEYSDGIHADDLENLKTGEYGYRYRLLENVVMPPYITPEKYQFSRTIQTRDSDICYTSYPKSGSTWLAYILVLIVNNGEIPACKDTLRNSLHWVASSWTYPRSQAELEATPSPRIFKSHMPYQMALGGDPIKNPCKYIYIARNPKDVAVSYYYFEREKSWSGYYSGPWDHWLKIFMEGNVQRGSWFDHVLSWWQHRDADNILFLRYEDLKANFKQELRKIMTFLGYEQHDDMITKIAEKTTFENMQKDNFSNMHEIKEFHSFFRKGKVRSWKEQFEEDQCLAFNEFYEKKNERHWTQFDLG